MYVEYEVEIGGYRRKVRAGSARSALSRVAKSLDIKIRSAYAIRGDRWEIVTDQMDGDPEDAWIRRRTRG
jgi:hypothetical protein